MTLRETPPDPDNIGRYARNVESGWLGKIVAVEGGNLYKLQGVNELCLTVAGGTRDQYLDDDDFQWMAHDDLVFQQEDHVSLLREPNPQRDD